MKGQKIKSILVGLAVLALVSVSCGISLPGTIPSGKTVATNVAKTVSALETTASSLLTPQIPDLPTLAPETAEPTSLPAAPLSVAFVSPDRNAFYWNETLSGATSLTTSGDVTLASVSPDGQLVALIRTMDDVSFSLDVINFDGTGLRTLLSPAAFAALPRPEGSVASVPYQVEWIPNTHFLAMNTRIQYEGPGLSTGSSLYLINPDDGSWSTPITLTDVWYYRFTISPDGRKIAISLPDGIEIYYPDGSKLDHKVLIYEFVNTASEYAWVASPVWSSDSTTLAAAVPPVNPFDSPLADSTVWRVTADGTVGEMTLSRKMIYSPSGFASISPDLGKIIYLTQYGPAENNLWTLNLSNLDGTDTTEYASGKIYVIPQWSNDSSKFYYYMQDSGAYIGQPGMAPLAQPDFANTSFVQWIDGNRFIGISGPIGGWKLLLGSVGSPAGVIFSTPVTSGSMMFSVNR